MLRPIAIFAAVAALVAAVSAQTSHQLSTGNGPGHMRVTVDGFGGFGGCFVGVGDLFFDTPLAGSVATTCGSALLLHESAVGAPRPFNSYATGGFPAPLAAPTITVHTPGQDIEASWNYLGWQINCRQWIYGQDPAGGPSLDGATLVQRYILINTDAVAHTIDIARWHDTDIGPGSQYLSNNAGATASVGSINAGLGPPFTGNGHVVFAYDALYPFVVMNSMEIVDASGYAVENDKWQVYNNSAGGSWITVGGQAAAGMTNSVNPDGNSDLLSDSPLDVALGLGVTGLVIPQGNFVTVIVRTRCSFLDPSSASTVPVQARDLSATVFNGTYLGSGVQPMLCVNGIGDVLSVAQGTPLTVSLSPPFAVPFAPYALFAHIGSPTTGNACGASRTLDFSFWGGPFSFLGVAGFPAVLPAFGLSWTGGGATPAFPLASDIPGLGVFTSGASGGGFPCGASILGPVALTQDVAISLQTLNSDPTVPLGLSMSNVVAVDVGGCTAPVR